MILQGRVPATLPLSPDPDMPQFLRRPGLIPTLAVLTLLALLVAAPLATIAADTLGSPAWTEVLASRLSRNLLWRPLGTTLIIGIAVAAGCLLIGGFLAWLVTMTDVPFRRAIGFMATLPFMIPSFATALAWGTLFRNGRTGGSAGLLQGMGFDVPDWLAWGIVPVILVLIAHYYALAFTVIDRKSVV